MNELTVFQHEEFGDVRIVDQDGEPWFVANDVAKILGYENMSRDIQRHCKRVKLLKSTDTERRFTESPRGINIIPESDVYRLIMRSNMPKAVEFQDWVVEEVLPDIRKHGFHGAEDFVERALADPGAAVKFLLAYKHEKEQKELMVLQRDEAIRTKAQIGTRREATSMNTASQYSKQNEQLRIQVGDATNWKAVKAIAWLCNEFIQSKSMYQAVGKRLSVLSKRMGYEKKYIEDMEHGSVGAYHVDVIERLRLEMKTDLNLLGKYRNGR